MVFRQVGEGSAGRRAGATRGELAPVDPVPAAHRLDHQGEIQSSKQASLPAQVAMGLIAEALAQTIQESLTAGLSLADSLWGQTDLEFSRLSLGSDRFRIFSAQARPRASSSSARCLFGVRPI